MSAWTSGVQVRRTDWGQTPVADLLCADCRTHVRVTGRDKVRDFLRSNPMAEHRVVCPNPVKTQGTQAA